MKDSKTSGDVRPTEYTQARVGVKRIWPLAIFFCLSAVASWTVWLWPLKREGWFTLTVLGWNLKVPFLLTKLVIGNCLPGILAVIWVLFEGKDQFRQMLSTLTKWRTPLKWYLVAAALPCGVFLVALDVVLLYSPTSHSLPPATQFFKTLLLSLPFGPLWEELAWRAFALRKLETRYSRLVSALIIGVCWALWHIPLWLVLLRPAPSNPISYVSAGVITLIAWSVIWTYLYHRSSGSLPVVILLHAAYGAASTQAALVVPYRNDYVIYVATGLTVCLAAMFARAMSVQSTNGPPSG